MAKYTVTVNEVAVVQNEYVVEAENEDEAIRLAEEGQGERELINVELREPASYDSMGFHNAIVEEKN